MSGNFFGLYLGPVRLTCNRIHPRRGGLNWRFLWEPLLWADWAVAWPTRRFFRKIAQ